MLSTARFALVATQNETGVPVTSINFDVIGNPMHVDHAPPEGFVYDSNRIDLVLVEIFGVAHYFLQSEDVLLLEQAIRREFSEP